MPQSSQKAVRCLLHQPFSLTVYKAENPEQGNTRCQWSPPIHVVSPLSWTRQRKERKQWKSQVIIWPSPALPCLYAANGVVRGYAVHTASIKRTAVNQPWGVNMRIKINRLFNLLHLIQQAREALQRMTPRFSREPNRCNRWIHRLFKDWNNVVTCFKWFPSCIVLYLRLLQFWIILFLTPDLFECYWLWFLPFLELSMPSRGHAVPDKRSLWPIQQTRNLSGATCINNGGTVAKKGWKSCEMLKESS